MFNATLCGIWHFGLLIYPISILILNLHLDNAPVCLCNFSLHNFVCIYAKIYIQMYCLDKLWSIKNINRYFILKNNIYRLGFFLIFFFYSMRSRWQTLAALYQLKFQKLEAINSIPCHLIPNMWTQKIYVWRTPKCDGTLKCNGTTTSDSLSKTPMFWLAKGRWSACIRIFLLNTCIHLCSRSSPV